MTRVALLTLVVFAAVGCSAGPAADGAARGATAKAATKATARQSRPHAQAAPAAPVVAGWDSFPATRAALKRDIAARAEALREGPLGGRAKQLASLRLAAAGLDLAVDGALAAALDSLQRALSLHGANGYACLGLAYVHLVQGRSAQAAEFVASARTDLPREAKVDAEVEALARAVAAGNGRS